MTEEAPSPSGTVLALLGLNTLANARATFVWTLPHLALSVGGLGLMSWLLERVLSPGIPLGGYLAAMALAAVVVFFTLALVRGAALRCEEAGDEAGAGGEASVEQADERED
jgi:hypothetical protein